MSAKININDALTNFGIIVHVSAKININDALTNIICKQSRILFWLTFLFLYGNRKDKCNDNETLARSHREGSRSKVYLC